MPHDLCHRNHSRMNSVKYSTQKHLNHIHIYLHIKAVSYINIIFKYVTVSEKSLLRQLITRKSNYNDKKIDHV